MLRRSLGIGQVIDVAPTAPIDTVETFLDHVDDPPAAAPENQVKRTFEQMTAFLQILPRQSFQEHQELFAECSEMLGELYELKPRCTALCNKVMDYLRAGTQAQWEEIKEQCRKQRDILQRVEQEATNAQCEALSAAEEEKSKRFHLEDAIKNLPNPNTWPTKSQMDAANRKVEAAREKLRAAMNQKSNVLNKLNNLETGILVRLTAAREEMRKLANEEARTRAMLEGNARFRDPETGLIENFSAGAA